MIDSQAGTGRINTAIGTSAETLAPIDSPTRPRSLEAATVPTKTDVSLSDSPHASPAELSRAADRFSEKACPQVMRDLLNAHDDLLAALKTLKHESESYVNLSRSMGESLRPEAADRLRNAIAVARDLLAEAREP